MNRFHNQRGMSVTSWILVIAIALFFALLALKLTGSYLRYYSIQNIMQEMADEGIYKTADVRTIRNGFSRHININNIYDFDKNSLTITKKKGGGMQMNLFYEDRKHMAGNVDVVLVFEKQVDL